MFLCFPDESSSSVVPRRLLGSPAAAPGLVRRVGVFGVCVTLETEGCEFDSVLRGWFSPASRTIRSAAVATTVPCTADEDGERPIASIRQRESFQSGPVRLRADWLHAAEGRGRGPPPRLRQAAGGSHQSDPEAAAPGELAGGAGGGPEGVHLSDGVLRLCLTLTHLNRALFLACDHLLWAGRTGLLPSLDHSKWSHRSFRYYLFALILSLTRDLYELRLLMEREERSKGPRGSSSAQPGDSASCPARRRSACWWRCCTATRRCCWTC
uniref:Uncharacterized protein n=1 Tax=Tetraodon nigroviridis TaxID=99883 RepID=H3CHE1_TETNG